jgi:hypothetical protein
MFNFQFNEPRRQGGREMQVILCVVVSLWFKKSSILNLQLVTTRYLSHPRVLCIQCANAVTDSSCIFIGDLIGEVDAQHPGFVVTEIA